MLAKNLPKTSTPKTPQMDEDSVTVLLKDCYDIDYTKYVTALGTEAVEKVLSKLWDLKRVRWGANFH